MSKPTSEVHNAVRQIMFNELGLNRDGIREMVREAVDEIVTKEAGKQFDRLLVRAINDKLPKYQDIEEQLAELTYEAVAKHWRGDEAEVTVRWSEKK